MTNRRDAVRLVIAALLVLLGGAGCRQPVRPVPDAGPALVVTAVRRGLASHYAAGLAGHPTASGELYDPAALTAAHRSLPLGTRVRVSRLNELGDTVIVRINDRGPFVEGRVIDLSEAAARRLAMWGSVARVKLEILKD